MFLPPPGVSGVVTVREGLRVERRGGGIRSLGAVRMPDTPRVCEDASLDQNVRFWRRQRPRAFKRPDFLWEAAQPRKRAASPNGDGGPAAEASVIELASWRQRRISACVEKHVQQAAGDNSRRGDDKRVIIEREFEMSGMKKVPDTSLAHSAREPRRRLLSMRKVTAAFLPNKVPQERRLIRPHLKSP